LTPSDQKLLAEEAALRSFDAEQITVRALLDRLESCLDNLSDEDLPWKEAFQQEWSVLYQRAEILCKMGKFSDAIETLRNAPFATEIDAFPALTYEAIFLYCYLLKRSGREPPPNLVAALPEDFVTRTWDGKKVGIADLSPPANGSTTPA